MHENKLKRYILKNRRYFWRWKPLSSVSSGERKRKKVLIKEWKKRKREKKRTNYFSFWKLNKQ